MLVALFGGTLIDLVYRGRYSKYGHLAWLIGLIVLPAAGITTICRVPSRVNGRIGSFRPICARPQRRAWAIEAWGLVGAIAGLLASSLTSMLVLLWWVVRVDRLSRPAAAAAEMAPAPAQSPADAGASLLEP